MTESAKGCEAEGPKGYWCTHHEDGQHVAAGNDTRITYDRWPIEPPLPRERYIETALAWAWKNGYSHADAALDEYCDARDLTWVSDPHYYFLTYSEKES